MVKTLKLFDVLCFGQWVSADLPRYNIQIAQSADAINWERNGLVAVDLLRNEDALARPYVVCEKMAYSKCGLAQKGPPIHLNMQFSENGLDRKITNLRFLHAHGLDDEMMCYPIALKHNDQNFYYTMATVMVTTASVWQFKIEL